MDHSLGSSNRVTGKRLTIHRSCHRRGARFSHIVRVARGEMRRAPMATGAPVTARKQVYLHGAGRRGRDPAKDLPRQRNV